MSFPYGRMNAIESALGGRAAVESAYESGHELVGGSTTDLADFVVGQFTVVNDGTAQGNGLIPGGTTPAWFDQASIVKPGLYVVSVEMAAEAGSSTGVHVSVKGAFGSEYIVSLDGMAALGPGGTPAAVLPDIAALGAADVPLGPVATIQMDDAAAAGGWVCAFRLRAARLVAAAS